MADTKTNMTATELVNLQAQIKEGEATIARLKNLRDEHTTCAQDMGILMEDACSMVFDPIESAWDAFTGMFSSDK